MVSVSTSSLRQQADQHCDCAADDRSHKNYENGAQELISDSD
jgi:hypothetical protein